MKISSNLEKMIEDQIASGDYQHVACNLCGSNNAVPYAFNLKEPIETHHVRRVKCRKCGFIYSDPQATEETLLGIYNVFYDSRKIGETVKDLDKNVLHGARRFFVELTETEKNIGQFRILDVGCNIGHWLSVGQEFGFDVYGVDISPICVEYARNMFGLDQVKNTDLFGAAFPDDFFDYVLLWHVLEHVRDPLALLAEIKRILKPGGTFRIGVPSVYDPIYITNRIICKLRRSLPSMSSSNLHTCEFTPSTLRLFLVKAGFYIQDLSSYYHSVEVLCKGRNLGFRQKLNVRFWWYVAKVCSRRPGCYGVIGPFGDGILSKFGNGIVAHCSKV